MPGAKKKIWTILITSLWIAMGIGLIVLLVAAIQRKSTRVCKGIEIEIKGRGDNFFVDKKDVRRILNVNNDGFTGKELRDFDLAKMERTLESNPWVRDAELYFDNNEILKVKVEEREPIARLFSVDGGSFYIDSSLKKLPLSEKFSARVPVFTNFKNGDAKWNKADSNVLKNIKSVSEFIMKDSLWMAQIGQVDITASGKFEMVPTIGDHIILFGDGYEAEKKFRRLFIFYRDVLSKIGWNKYSAINVQYKGQVIATKKETINNKATGDTTRVNDLLRQMMLRSPQQWMGDDTLGRALPNYPATRSVAPANAVTLLKTIASESTTVPAKSNSEKPASILKPKLKPKATMPKK